MLVHNKIYRSGPLLTFSGPNRCRVYFFPILCCFFSFLFLSLYCHFPRLNIQIYTIQIQSNKRENSLCSQKNFFFLSLIFRVVGIFFFFSEGRGGLHPLETSSMPSTAASLVFIFSVCSHWSMRKSVVMQRFVSLSEIIGKKKKIGTFLIALAQRPVA